MAVTDAAHVATAARLRHDYQNPTVPSTDQDEMVRDLADYDRAFGLDQAGQP